MHTILKALIILIAIIAVLLIIFRVKPPESEHPHISEQQQLVQQIETLNQKLSQTEDDLRRVITRYSKEDPQLFHDELSHLQLTQEAQDFLSQMLEKEEGISYEEIVQQVIDRDREISALRRERERLLALLPQPDIVEEGDNHYDLAMRFLIERQDLSPSEAQKFLERVALFDHLLPGFVVYHFFDGIDYGTSVLQGTAKQSPNFIKERFMNQLIREKNEAIEMQKQLANELQELEIRKNMLYSQISALETERQNILEALDQISLLSKEQDIMLSSLYYYAGSVSKLKDDGIISVSIFGKPSLKNIEIIEDFKLIDLDMADRIIINAEEIGIKRIQRIHVLPDLFEQGKDFTINLAPDGSVFEICVLNKKRLKLEKIIIAVQ